MAFKLLKLLLNIKGSSPAKRPSTGSACPASGTEARGRTAAPLLDVAHEALGGRREKIRSKVERHLRISMEAEDASQALEEITEKIREIAEEDPYYSHLFAGGESDK